MNERDSEAVHSLLCRHGHTPCDTEQDADLLLYNTCSVRERAENKVRGRVSSLRALKKRRPEVLIGILGCMAQNHGEKLSEELEHVDFVLGTDQYHQLPDVLRQAGKDPIVNTEQKTDMPADVLSEHDSTSAVSAKVAVMRGCNQFCSYCIVPYVRGREKSRPIKDVVQEVEQLAAQGVREVLLLGQSITGYGRAELRAGRSGYNYGGSPFADLLRAVNNVEGIERIRFTSPHPLYMDNDVLEALIELPKVCQSFHVPIQSGSDRILKAMNRGYTAEHCRRIFTYLREQLPEAAFSTDIIVGFPGETEKDFLQTRDMMQEIGFDMAFIFKYSPRQGTKAAKWEDDVETAVKAERNQVLLADLNECTRRRNEELVDQRVKVLVEGPSAKNPARWTGRTEQNKVCIFDPASCERGDLLDMYVNAATPNALYTEPLGSTAAAGK